MKTIVVITVCILFAGCATTQSPVPSPGTEAELASCKEKVAELKKKIDDEDNSSSIQIYDD